MADRGYAATTVHDVITRARVSRTAFYGNFNDKQEAFAEAHIEASRQLLDLIGQRLDGEGETTWRNRLRAKVEAYVEGLQSAPTYAVSFLVELRAAGAQLLDQRDRVLEQHARNFADLAVWAAAQDPTVRRPSDLEVIGVIGAIDELATRAVRAGDMAGLTQIIEPAMALQEALLTSPRHDQQRS